MKKILFVEVNSPGYNSDGMAQAWRDVGFDEVIRFNWQQYRFTWGINKTREKIISLAQENKPDLIFLHLQNGSIVDVDTAKILQEIAPTVNYTFDVREKISWYKNIAPHITHTFFACKEDVWECHVDGIDNISMLHSSDNFEWYKKFPSIPDSITDRPEIVFIGSKYPYDKFEGAIERDLMVAFLYDTYGGEKFAAYGMGQKWGFIHQQKAIQLYNTAKIAISQNLMYRTEYTSDRLFRIIACGCLCLTKHFGGVEKYFQRGVELDTWKTFDDLKLLIDFYLEHPIERESVAKAGMNLVRTKHRWIDRWKKVLEVIDFKF